MTAFRDTHLITFTPLTGTAAEHWFVMITKDGAAYTSSEWRAYEYAAWKRDTNGTWTYEGQATPEGRNGHITITRLR